MSPLQRIKLKKIVHSIMTTQPLDGPHTIQLDIRHIVESSSYPAVMTGNRLKLSERFGQTVFYYESHHTDREGFGFDVNPFLIAISGSFKAQSVYGFADVGSEKLIGNVKLNADLINQLFDEFYYAGVDSSTSPETLCAITEKTLLGSKSWSQF